VIGDLILRHFGEAMEKEDVAAVSRQAPYRSDERPAHAVFGRLPPTIP
jgi:hypothetical protein